MVAEGVRTAAAVRELSDRHGVPMPVCTAIGRVLSGEIPASDAYQGLRVDPGHESEPG
jgi:glycerol-3-phosphate dehydrogenase